MLAAANLSIRHHSVAVRAQVFLSLLRYLDVEVDIRNERRHHEWGPLGDEVDRAGSVSKFASWWYDVGIQAASTFGHIPRERL